MTVRFRLESDGEWWVAQCLEHDIAVQAKTLPAAAEELQRVIKGRIVVAKKLGVAPFAGVPPASEITEQERFELEVETSTKIAMYESAIAAQEVIIVGLETALGMVRQGDHR